MVDVLALPAHHGARNDLPSDLGESRAIVQGPLIHDASALRLFGQPPAAFRIDRTTRPVLERNIWGHLPTTIVVLIPFFQRQIVSGQTAGAVKG